MSTPPLPRLPIDAVLATAPASPTDGERVGRSREGREIRGFRLGSGPLHVSLLAGNHADEPVGPAMLDRLVACLAARPADDPLLVAASWWIVPHTNPDGEARNAGWTRHTVALPAEGEGYDLRRYLREVVREPPGDDLEFGFPRHADDDAARPENRAVTDFLRPGAPFALHASFHGMGFAAGPWFLLEAAWEDRTSELRDDVRRTVRAMGYTLHDVDRGGEKGFRRIDEGFTTRPDSRAMAAHFLAAGDTATADLFRPSSMETVRGWGGDPLTLVSEMPLFLLPAACFRGAEPVRPAAIAELRALAIARRDNGGGDAFAAAVARHEVQPMPIADQMRLQLVYLDAALRAVAG